MMRKLLILLTAVFLLLIDQTILPFFSVYGSHGSLMFAFFGLFALLTDFEDAVLVGLITGVLQDIFFPYAFGLNTMLNMLLFLGLSRIGLTLKEGRKTIPVLFVTLAQGIKTLIMIVVLLLFGIRGNYFSVLITPAFTLIMAMFIYRVVISFSRIPIIKKEWRF